MCFDNKFYLENSSCMDTFNHRGNCIRFMDCLKFYSLYNSTTPLTYKNRRLIKDNFCGSDTEQGRYFVCCSPEPIPVEPEKTTTTTTANPISTTTPIPVEPSYPWLESLKSKVNQEACVTVPDRIYGGTTTSIDEYPWTVLLEYTRRKTFIFWTSLTWYKLSF